MLILKILSINVYYVYLNTWGDENVPRGLLMHFSENLKILSSSYLSLNRDMVGKISIPLLSMV